MQSLGVLQHYRPFLPVTDHTPQLTLGEGGTPLLEAPRLSTRLGIRLHLKFEGQNPTGSFKDRGMVVAVAKAAEEGRRAVVCASTGNTSASAAAYAARMGMRATVVIPSGQIARGKLAQAIAYGAQVISIEGNFDEALRIVRALAQDGEFALVNSLNPHRLEGQKTAAFEIVDALGDAPDVLALPVGNAGNITAYSMGFAVYEQAGRASRRPALYGFQAAGAAPIVGGRPVDRPETVATAIRIGNPASWQRALDAVARDGGGFMAVTDDQIVAAQALLAREEGVFAEPASAASIAGLLRRHELRQLPAGATVVAVLTGTGLKDPDAALRLAGDGELPRVAPSLDAVRSVIERG